MKTNNLVNTHQLTLLAVIVAANVAIARVFLIPIPMTHGNINLCDTGIFLAAWLFGSKKGGVVGGLSGFLLDLISGYPQYMVFSLIVHGLEGFIVGKLTEDKKISAKSLIISLIAGVLFMVLGYLVSDSLLYKFSTILNFQLNLYLNGHSPSPTLCFSYYIIKLKKRTFPR